MGVEDLLQKHSLLEADIKVIGERVKSVNKQADPFGITANEAGESKAPTWRLLSLLLPHYEWRISY